VDLPSLLDPHNPLVLAVEQTLTRGHEWSRTAAPMAQRIAVRVAGAIVRNRLKPGERLLENEVSAALGVSRAPTREALRILERERLVFLQARHGGVVAALDRIMLEEIFSARAVLHGLPFTELMERKPVELASALHEALPGVHAAARSSPEEYVVRSYVLNLRIVDLAANRLVADLLTSMALRTLRLVRLGCLANPLAIARSARRWNDILQAVVRGDLRRVLQAVHLRTEDTRRTAIGVVPVRTLPA
jgi:DNA-binding GntR family transcriptional regulator